MDMTAKRQWKQENKLWKKVFNSYYHIRGKIQGTPVVKPMCGSENKN